MLSQSAFGVLASTLRGSRGLAGKAEIVHAVTRLGLSASSLIAVGDDCAAIPDGDGFLLFAMEGFINAFVAQDPWFAGWCGIMVNVSDIVAMGGRPIAVVDAIWAKDADSSSAILDGLQAASSKFNVPIVGGHTNLASAQGQLAVAILGRAKKLLTSFDAEPGDHLIAAIDLRGRYRDPFMNWEAATDAPADRLRADHEILATLAEEGLSGAAKDISQGGVVGTAGLFAECSGVSMCIDVAAVPRPEGVDLARWLQTFPSFGYLVAVKPHNVAAVLKRFSDRNIAAADIGLISGGYKLSIRSGAHEETIWNFAEKKLTSLTRAGAH